MARVTVEDCIDKVESPYQLVLVAKERTTQLNLAGLSSGMYIISIQNICGGASSFKLILNTD